MTAGKIFLCESFLHSAFSNSVSDKKFFWLRYSHFRGSIPLLNIRNPDGLCVIFCTFVLNCKDASSVEIEVDG
jgi:hypothetical protein